MFCIVRCLCPWRKKPLVVTIATHSADLIDSKNINWYIDRRESIRLIHVMPDWWHRVFDSWCEKLNLRKQPQVKMGCIGKIEDRQPVDCEPQAALYAYMLRLFVAMKFFFSTTIFSSGAFLLCYSYAFMAWYCCACVTSQIHCISNWLLWRNHR